MARIDERPFIAIWETTQACDLACQHCRASARPDRSAGELDTEEAKRLLDTLADAGVPLVVLTGGDPAKREDLVELIAHGSRRGLNMGLTPSATPLVTTELIEQLGKAGLSRLAVSIDAPDAAGHDAFRGVAGSFDLSLRILSDARRFGIRTQINTSIHAGNLQWLEAMTPVVRAAGAVLWSVFFVVPTGRAQSRMVPDAALVEDALGRLADIADREPFAVKTTAAPHYRRILIERKASRSHGTHGSHGLRVNDGRGFLFISHLGELYPSGFLPVSCGNVRTNHPLSVYRFHPVFRALRDPHALTGKCGACEYRAVCGGSRARAYAMTGSLLASDPLCAYVPPDYVPEEQPSYARRYLDVVR